MNLWVLIKTGDINKVNFLYGFFQNLNLSGKNPVPIPRVVPVTFITPHNVS